LEQHLASRKYVQCSRAGTRKPHLLEDLGFVIKNIGLTRHLQSLLRQPQYNVSKKKKKKKKSSNNRYKITKT
jgi:hypothetical protein